MNYRIIKISNPQLPKYFDKYQIWVYKGMGTWGIGNVFKDDFNSIDAAEKAINAEILKREIAKNEVIEIIREFEL